MYNLSGSHSFAVCVVPRLLRGADAPVVPRRIERCELLIRMTPKIRTTFGCRKLQSICASLQNSFSSPLSICEKSSFSTTTVCWPPPIVPRRTAPPPPHCKRRPTVTAEDCSMISLGIDTAPPLCVTTSFAVVRPSAMSGVDNNAAAVPASSAPERLIKPPRIVLSIASRTRRSLCLPKQSGVATQVAIRMTIPHAVIATIHV